MAERTVLALVPNPPAFRSLTSTGLAPLGYATKHEVELIRAEIEEIREKMVRMTEAVMVLLAGDQEITG